MKSKWLQKDASVLMRAADQANRHGLISQDTAERLAEGLRAALRLSEGDHLVLLGAEPNAKGSGDAKPDAGARENPCQ